MNTRHKKYSFNFKTTFTIALYSVIILLVFYLFQSLYLSYFYEVKKIDEVKKIARDLLSEDSNIALYLESITDKNDVCIEYYTPWSKTLYNKDLKGCLLKNPNDKISELMTKMIESEEANAFYRITNPLYKTKSFLYGMRLGNDYVFINSELESLDLTMNALEGQLFYLLILVLLLSVLISFIISHSITRPIFAITEKAKKMGKGDLSVKFEKSEISEIDELSESLNYAIGEMTKVDDYRRDLMANVGHDLKTPLTLIKSYAEMVRDISYKDDEKRCEHLGVIITESERLNELVNDIITLSKLEASYDNLDYEEFDLVAEIKNIIDKFEILEITENYNFVYTGVETAVIEADKSKINQVIYNLINNAINYTGDDQMVYVSVIEEGKGYRVDIRDTGKGIDEKMIAHVWDRYYKTEKKHKRGKVGTGLGLAIVREILEAHNFKYGVKSTIGEGSTFYFKVNKKK